MKIWTSAKSPKAVEYSMAYSLIVCVGSLEIFLESIFAKMHQAGGNMRIPMAAWVLFSIDAG
jgi:Na+-driven multidrug efflux pump